jgi:transposase
VTIPERIELSPEQMQTFMERVESHSLQEQDYTLILGMAQTILFLSRIIEEKRGSIRRLLRMLFGPKTESSKKVLKPKEPDENAQPCEQSSSPAPSAQSDSPASPPSKKKGHGRNGAQAYTGAQKIFVRHETYKSGDPCPECPNGRLHPLREPSVVVRVVGKAPLDAVIYELERLRCSPCGKIFTATMPSACAQPKYDFTAGTMIALLKYGSGFPFHRLEKLQQALGIPLPASTQWEVVEKAADLIHPVFLELIVEAAQGEIVHNDDTTARIVSVLKEIQQEPQERTGIFTTAVVSVLGEHRIAIFFTGRKHAGENLDEVLQERSAELDPPIQMSDALSRNAPKHCHTLTSYCMVHARRGFVEVSAHFSEECRHVLEAIGKIYLHDQIGKEEKMSPEQRFEYHRTHSAPVMEELRTWCIDQKEKIEPNSGLGKAIEYLLKHWDKLTLFLQVPGAPLDNNLCEQALKRVILHRKNAMFFKTEHGAYIADLFISLIHTCSLNGVNPFDYLNALQEHSAQVRKEPHKWMPWNYRENLDPSPPGG